MEPNRLCSKVVCAEGFPRRVEGFVFLRSVEKKEANRAGKRGSLNPMPPDKGKGRARGAGALAAAVATSDGDDAITEAEWMQLDGDTNATIGSGNNKTQQQAIRAAGSVEKLWMLAGRLADAERRGGEYGPLAGLRLQSLMKLPMVAEKFKVSSPAFPSTPLAPPRFVGSSENKHHTRPNRLTPRRPRRRPSVRRPRSVVVGRASHIRSPALPPTALR